MSWLDNVFGWLPRLFGWGKPKDKPIPNPLPGSERMQLKSDGTDRAKEAIAAIRGWVREPYIVTDRELVIASVSWAEGKAYFVSRGNKPVDWPGNHIGHSYAPKSGFNETHGLMHLVSTNLTQPDRVKLPIHEYGHIAVWHWLMLDTEWVGWQARGWTYEEFADDFARRMMGDKLSGEKQKFFEALEARLRSDGTKAQRL